MSSFKEKMSQNFMPRMMEFFSNKPMTALKDGMIYIVPLSLIGSVFLLLAQLPIPAFNNWMNSVFGIGWTIPLFQVYHATFDIFAIVAVMAIPYIYVKNNGYEPLSAAIVGLICFVTTISNNAVSLKGVTVENVMDKNWTGGKGLIASILIGLFVGWLYSWFLKKKITFKMPAGVPEGVAAAFTALIPGFVCVVISDVIFGLFQFVTNGTLIEWIYKVIQTPLQGATDSIWGAILIGMAIPFFWWFGVHGAALMGGVTGPLLLANTLANQELLSKTGHLTLNGGAHVVVQQFQDQFLTFGGSGLTLGLVLMMLIWGRSARSKELGKMAIVPGLFNINEPVLFGFPIVLNPFMIIPFIAAPTASAILTYICIRIGFVGPFTGVQVPWTTPAPISGFLIGGWRAALLQIVVVVMTMAIYYPFFKKQDKLNLDEEKAGAAQEQKID